MLESDFRSRARGRASTGSARAKAEDPELAAHAQHTRPLHSLCWTLAVLGVVLATLPLDTLPPVLLALIGVGVLYRIAMLLEVPVLLPNIVVTETDTERLTRLLDALPAKQRLAAFALERELERAHVVAARHVPGDVVTMNSRVVFEEVHSGVRAEVSLVYPSESRADGAVSVLAPVGSALLGLCVGQTIDWPMPSGRLRRYQIVDVVYQPEAAGDLHL